MTTTQPEVIDSDDWGVPISESIAFTILYFSHKGFEHSLKKAVEFRSQHMIGKMDCPS